MYRTKEIAELVGVHPNTVRIYEEWGFISPVPRGDNNYRMYSDVHLLQLNIARTLFRCEIVQGNMRHRARQIVYASGAEDFGQARRLTADYIVHLEREYEHALAAANVVQRWLSNSPAPSATKHSRRDVARILGTTPETIRNWERNGLLTVPRTDKGYRVYGCAELEQLRVIRGLRAAHYSMSAILRLLQQVDQPHPDVIKILNTPSTGDEIVSVTDQLVSSLTAAQNDAAEALAMLTNHILATHGRNDGSKKPV